MTASPDQVETSAANGATMPGQRTRSTPATVLTVTGACCVVLGGLVAAMTGPLDVAHGSWLAAYLVLVGGVAQYAMGRARVWLTEVSQPKTGDWAQIGAWNLGNALVIGGTLTGAPLLVDLGSVLLITALAIAMRTTRPTTGEAANPATGPRSSLIRRAYWTLLLVLAISIPVGIVLSHLRHA